MKLHVDLDTLQFIEGPGFRNPVDRLRFKRGDSATLEVVFLLAGTTPTTLGVPADLAIELGLKPEGGFGGDYLVHETAWTKPAVGSANPVYSCSPNFSTVELDTAMGIGGTELPELAAMAEISWTLAGAAPTSTRTVEVTVENDVNRGTEGTPLELPTPEQWLSDRAVRFDGTMSLDSTQRGQARLNIGLGESDAPTFAGVTIKGSGAIGKSIILSAATTPIVATFPDRAGNPALVTGPQTFSGAQTFSGQVELTGQVATNGTSAMTKNLIREERTLLDHYDNWDIWTGYSAMATGGNNGTGSYATIGSAQSGNTVGGWARILICQITTRPHGAGSNAGLCAVPLAVSLFGSFSPSATGAVRIIVGDVTSGTPAWSTANPIAARGFGVEVYVVAGVVKARLFAHNGTTFAYGSNANFTGIWSGQGSLVVASNGAGKIMLYHVGSDSHSALAKPTLLLSMNGGPTDSVYGNAGCISMVAVGDNVNPSNTLGVIVRGRIHLNHPLT